MQSLREMIQDRTELLQEKSSKQKNIDLSESATVDASVSSDLANPQSLSILCLPSRTDADEITAAMVSQILESDGSHVQTASLASLSAEEFKVAGEFAADVVFLSATPPAAVMHARHLCKRIRAELPDVKLFVGLWRAQGDLAKAQEQIGCGAVVVATLADAQAEIRKISKSQLV